MAWLNLNMPNQTLNQIAPNEFFSRKTTNKIFMYLLVPFILQNFKKVLELWGCAIFGYKMAQLSWTNHYFWYTPLFHCAKFKKNSSSRSRVMRMRNFWAPNDIFFRKSINEPCFFHSCQSTCQNSKLVKYWQLRNTEISLAESLFWL